MSNGDPHIAFQPLDDQSGIEVVDRIERRRYKLHTPDPVEPTPTGTDSFWFPVDRAVRYVTDGITLPQVATVVIRDEAGTMVANIDHLESSSVPEGQYILELETHIKTYLEVDGPLEVAADMFQTYIEFPSPTVVRHGARSRHRRPATTVTTTEDPRDVMAAVEMFGSGLKTTSPERSYPTLRGHPPAVELGDALSVPDSVERPETGVTLEVPVDLSSAYTVAPLAYYLGASIVPGPSPRLVTDDGLEYSLSAPDGFQPEVKRTLKRVFFLDCLTRTEGYYQVDLWERNAVEPDLDLDFAALYDQPLTEQLDAYLDVPFGLIEDHIPRWQTTAHVQPRPDSLEQLPYVVDDLAIVRTDDSHSMTSTGQPTTTSDLTRSGTLSRSGGGTATESVDYVQPEATDALEQVWIGDGVPIGASKPTVTAFQNRFDREKTDGDIAITIVVNDERMDEERNLVDDAYGERDNLPFEVTVQRSVPTDDLRDLLAERCDFFHYIGHTEEDGLNCPDGKLNLRTVDTTGVGSFLLNSCNSYKQGLCLVDAGAIGGIVTLNDVVNDSAVQIGETLARLLNAGFPLQSALLIAREESAFGGQYTVVGDGSVSVTQPTGTGSHLYNLTEINNQYQIKINTYNADGGCMGSIFTPHIQWNEQYFLIPGHSGTFKLDRSELIDFFQIENVPVKTDDDLRWSSSLADKLGK